MRDSLLIINSKEFSAPMNLAINEACLEFVSLGKYKTIARIYEFKDPYIILSSKESVWDVRSAVNVTRRMTGGSVIYVDDNTLGYTIASRNEFPRHKDYQDLYVKLTKPLAEKLSQYIEGLTLGRLYSMRINGAPFSGHAQRRKKYAYQYDGIAHTKKLDLDKLEEIIKLRKLGEKDVIIIDNNAYDKEGKTLNINAGKVKILRDEKFELERMPDLQSLGVSKEMYKEIFSSAVKELFNVEVSEVPDEILNRAEELHKKYVDLDFIHNYGNQKCLGYCLIDFLEPE